tara:strand:- start:12 stop:443 length:432 start_codon:yes stop_codon:yes gene_type:complete
MNFLISIILIFLFSTNVFAYKHLKTSNFDLRTKTILLSIAEQKATSYEIHKSVSDEYFLDIQKKSKKLERTKISNFTAEKYDNFFVSMFINLKYSLPPFSGKSCSKIYTLSMRGETQNICKGEKEKLSIMAILLDKIKKIYVK